MRGVFLFLGVSLGIQSCRVNHGESTTVSRHAGYGIVIIGNVSGGTCGLYIIANRSVSHLGGTDLSSVVSLTKPSEYGLTISNVSSADNVDCIIISI